jgi:hypothetical protein
MSRVGQFFGKLFAGQGDKNETVLRAYGKLPLYAEYRRLELAPGTPTTFSHWMDDGRLAWARLPSRSTSATVRPSRLVIRLPETREAVVASIWDSRDSLGRVFPLAFFVVCPPEALGDDPFKCWVSAFAIHETLEQFHRELAALGRGGDFYRLYQKRTVVLRPEDLGQRTKRLRYDASQIAAQEWFKAALGSSDANVWFAGLAQRVQRWKSQGSAVSGLALSCPLARGMAHEVQALLWLTWIERLLSDTGKLPGLIIPAPGDYGRVAMHILVRELLPDDFQLLTTDADQYGYVERLAEVPQPGPPEQSASQPPGVPVARPVTDAQPASSDSAPPRGPLLDWLKKHQP